VAVYIEPEGTTISISQIIRKLRQFFGPVVPEICVVSSLPRSADGRIDKARLVAGEIPPMSLEAVDKAMLELLNRRALLSAEAPRGDESPLSADETVLQRMVGSNAGPLFDDSVREIFRCILDHSRRT
jgi:chorismate mutase